MNKIVLVRQQQPQQKIKLKTQSSKIDLSVTVKNNVVHRRKCNYCTEVIAFEQQN